jgi:hypothetical protein
MPDTVKNPSQTVDKGNPGKDPKDEAKDSGQDRGNHGTPAGPGSAARKPGEADAPNIPEKAKPDFK